MHAAVETLFKYGDVAGGNLEAPINLLFMEYLEKTHTRNLLATATKYASDRREKPELGEKRVQDTARPEWVRVRIC